MGMSTKAYWAEIDAERAAKRDKDIAAAREAIGLDALKADAMLSPMGICAAVLAECREEERLAELQVIGARENVGKSTARTLLDDCFEGPEDRAEHEARVRLMEGGA